jgi:hypothetical protein
MVVFRAVAGTVSRTVDDPGGAAHILTSDNTGNQCLDHAGEKKAHHLVRSNSGHVCGHSDGIL